MLVRTVPHALEAVPVHWLANAPDSGPAVCGLHATQSSARRCGTPVPFRVRALRPHTVPVPKGVLRMAGKLPHMLSGGLLRHLLCLEGVRPQPLEVDGIGQDGVPAAGRQGQAQGTGGVRVVDKRHARQNGRRDMRKQRWPRWRPNSRGRRKGNGRLGQGVHAVPRAQRAHRCRRASHVQG